jgi:hypothetical protein
MGTESDENLRLNYFNLSLEVGQAAYDLIRSGVAIARRATFQYVAYEDIASFEPAGCDYLVQQLPGPADKGTSLRIFVGARRFAHEHYAGIWIALSGHGVCPLGAQVALAALTNFVGDSFEFSSFLGNGHTILLILWFRRLVLPLKGKTGQKPFHLKVLANNFTNIHIIFHRRKL